MAGAHFDRLLAGLGERAKAEIAQVRADAEEQATELRVAADRVVARRRADALAACEAEYMRRRAAAAADARHDARGTLLRAQHALVATVMSRARGMVVDRLARDGESPTVAARIAELESFASDGVVTSDDGLKLVANDGRLVIDDTVDAWLDGERAQIAIDVCRAVEAT
jgi:vacuolar-type H+-ATPase subunit E/Vma4